MTHTQIQNATIIWLDDKFNSDKEFYKMFNETLDENLESPLLETNGILDDVYEGIDECGFEEDKWGGYPDLKIKELEDILSQVL
tara:strand:- start:92 stop:343 length:252 start_codon:yes stop_codon:yes gene_type:complete